jgi:hypothetical protein
MDSAWGPRPVTYQNSRGQGLRPGEVAPATAKGSLEKMGRLTLGEPPKD